MDWQLAGLFALIWLIPVGLTVPSRRLDMRGRLRWGLIVLLTSWAGFLVFCLLAPGMPDGVIDELGRVHPDATPEPDDHSGEHHDTGL